jgi:hypothetical protein
MVYWRTENEKKECDQLLNTVITLMVGSKRFREMKLYRKLLFIAECQPLKSSNNHSLFVAKSKINATDILIDQTFHGELELSNCPGQGYLIYADMVKNKCK